MEQATNLTLSAIESTLSQLLDLRDQAETEGNSEAVTVIDQQIQEYFVVEVKKVDSIANAYRTFAHYGATARAEAERLHDRARKFEKVCERIKAWAQYAMERNDKKRLDSPLNTLRVQANGGLQPLEVYDPMAVPLEMKQVTITMRASDWMWLKECGDIDTHACTREYSERVEPDSEAIRDALKKRHKCPECDGVPFHPQKPGKGYCARCEGKGDIPDTVPGARLLERGRHLRIE